MQAAEEQSQTQAPGDGSGPGFLSPGKAFALLIGVIVIIGLIIFLTRPDLPRGTFTYPGNAEPPTFELTDAEALARFEELHSLFREGSMERDPSIIDVAMTSDSPLREVALQDIEQLERDRVLDRSRFTTRSADIVENNPNEVVVLQHVEVYPKFVAERTRREVTRSSPTLDTVRWILRPEIGVWKVYRAIVIESMPLDQS